VPVERIANRQIFIILFIVRSIIAISTMPVLTSADALQDAWLSLLLVFLPAALVLLWLLASLGVRFPRQTLVQYSITLLGPWLGRAAAAPFLWVFLFFAALEARIYGVVIVGGFLPETPLVFITATMIITAALAAWLGLEVIGRMADLLFPFFLIAVLLSIFMPLPMAEPANLQPVLARGWDPLFRGALSSIGLLTQFGILAFIAPSATEPRRLTPWVLSALVMSALLAAAIAAMVIMIKGAEEGARAFYPLLSMVRSVRVSPVIERAEVLSMFAWGLGLFISLAAYIYAGARGLSQFFSIRDYRPLVLPMAVIWAVLSVHLLEDDFQLRALMEYRVMGPYGISLLIIPLFLLWAVYGLRALLSRLNLPGGLPPSDREKDGDR
jgi:spore germination protein KB